MEIDMSFFMSLKLKPAFKTEVYVEKTGYFVIKQIDAFGKVVQIYLTPEQGKAISAYFQEKSVQASELWSIAIDGENNEVV